MKYFLLAMVLTHLSYADVEREGDLLQPVSDVSQIQKQEEEQIPTLDEVPMYESPKKPAEKNIRKSETKKVDRLLE